jgi:hypothetical protein
MKWLGWAALCLGGFFVVWPLTYNVFFMLLEYVLPDVLTQYAFVGGLMFFATLIVSVVITFGICGAIAQRLGIWKWP